MQMRAILGFLMLMLSAAVCAGPWPTDNITTVNVDAPTDDPSQARAEIYTTMQRVKDIIAARGSASGVASLDASSLVPLANIPDIAGKNISNSILNSTTIGATTPSTGAFTTLTISGAASSTKSCAGGYTRVGGNLCITASATTTSLTRSACTSIAPPAGDATSLFVFVSASAISANAIASRTASIYAYSNSACTTQMSPTLVSANGYEFATLAAGSYVLGADRNMVVIKLPSPGVYIYFSFLDDPGDFGAGAYQILGYMD